MALVHTTLRPGISAKFVGASVQDFDGTVYGNGFLRVKAGDALLLLPSPLGSEPGRGWSYGVCGPVGWFPTTCGGQPSQSDLVAPQLQKSQPSAAPAAAFPDAGPGRTVKRRNPSQLSPARNEKIQTFCIQHGIGPKLTLKMVDMLSRRSDTFEEDIMYLTVQLAGAKNPEALLGQKLHNVINNVHLADALSSSLTVAAPANGSTIRRSNELETATGAHVTEQQDLHLMSGGDHLGASPTAPHLQEAVTSDQSSLPPLLGTSGPTYSRNTLLKVYHFFHSSRQPNGSSLVGTTKYAHREEDLQAELVDFLVESLRGLGGSAELVALVSVAQEFGVGGEQDRHDIKESLNSAIQRRPDLFQMTNGVVSLLGQMRREAPYGQHRMFDIEPVDDEAYDPSVPATSLSVGGLRRQMNACQASSTGECSIDGVRGWDVRAGAVSFSL